jgi:hypothetical protein
MSRPTVWRRIRPPASGRVRTSPPSPRCHASTPRRSTGREIDPPTPRTRSLWPVRTLTRRSEQRRGVVQRA